MSNPGTAVFPRVYRFILRNIRAAPKEVRLQCMLQNKASLATSQNTRLRN